jgi:acetyl esterase/lipase
LGGGVSKGGGPDGSYDVCFTGVPDPDVIVGIAGCYYEVEGEKVWPVADMIVDNIDNVTLEPDLVLLVGADDPYCEPWQSEGAATTLQSVGYNVELAVIPGGNHSNVVFKAHVEGEPEWVNVPNDPAGQQVVQIILDAIDAAQQ